MIWETLEAIVGTGLLFLLLPVYIIYTVGASIFIIMDNRQPSSTFAWIFLFILFPLFGVIIYVLFGRGMRPFSRQKRLARLGPEMETALGPLMESLLEREAAALRSLRSDDELSHVQGKLAEMLRRTNLAMLTAGNRVELMQDAATVYPRMEEDIRQAKHSIHLEYFTWTADEYMQKLADLLIEKAQAGVQVRLLYDALGSFTLDWRHRGYVGRLRAGGVEVYSYLNRFFLLSLHTINYRNHRKITVIDGHIGYTGGLNMGLEHLIGAGPYHAWRDTHLRITGEAVAVLQAVFATSWYNTIHEHLTDPCYFVAAAPDRCLDATGSQAQPLPLDAGIPGDGLPPHRPNIHRTDIGDTVAHETVAHETVAHETVAHETDQTPPAVYDNVPVQIVGSGPDSQWFAIQQLYFFMIPLANKHVYIQSPFFIPDPSISEALLAAALAGVDVRIMCARRDTQNPVSNWAANTYFDEMARAGVKIYLMQSAYLHSKTISIDSAICSVGTANMDLRSFQVNYEINAVLYHRDLAAALEAQFHKDMKDCLPFDRDVYHSRAKIPIRARDSLARLVSPLL